MHTMVAPLTCGGTLAFIWLFVLIMLQPSLERWEWNANGNQQIKRKTGMSTGAHVTLKVPVAFSS